MTGVMVDLDRPQSRRDRFVSRVTKTLADAGIDYVLIHGYGGEDRTDKDVDLCVDRGSLSAVDALLRAGSLGRCCLRLHYDIPWCFTYVLESDEPSWRFRQIDVACDPWGIGKYGPALPAALAYASGQPHRRVPSPAARVLYLASKRGWKHEYTPAGTRFLHRAFKEDPEGAARLLEQYFGQSGRSLAEALARRQVDIEPELKGVARTVARQRLSPPKLARRVYFLCRRVLGRITHPTGLVVACAGPDGVGKSTLAHGLETAAVGLFRRTRRFHVGPALLPPPARILRREVSDGREPHARPTSGPIVSLARLAYLILDGIVVSVIRFAAARVRTSLVLVERSWYDLVVDPVRFRVSLPPRLIRAAIRLVPRPDLVLVLRGSAELVRGRKDELPPAEINRQQDTWARLASADPARFVTIDAGVDERDVLEAALGTITHRLAARSGDWRLSLLLMRCLGGPTPGGTPYSLVCRRHQPRWLIPTRAGVGPRGAGLYRPAGPTQGAGIALLELLHRSGAAAFHPTIPFAVRRGILPAIEEVLGRSGLELAGAAPRPGHDPTRALLAILDRGRPVAFARVQTADVAKLERERKVLELLADKPLASLTVPQVRDVFDWNGCSVLVVDALPAPGRAQRPLGRLEYDALAELGSAGDQLAPVLDRSEGLIPVHGDFAPWNSARLNGRLALWDWEEARLGLPLEDFFHWQLQRLILFGRGSVEALVESAVRPDPALRHLCERLGASVAVAPAALRAVLERNLEAGPEASSAIRRSALALLSERTR